MRNKYGIGIFIILFMFVIILTGSGYYFYNSQRQCEKEESMLNQQTAMEQPPQDTVAADGHALKENCFYLMEVNGYVVVYLSDKKTAYEYTDVIFEELPETVRNEIKNGKYIESLDELYGFLENYSS
ncbi:MAG: hypothetical protein ACI4UH_04430 [Dorea sp.]